MLPSKITFYCKQKDKDGIHHAFPVDSKASHNTAKEWAKDKSGKWKDGVYVREAKDPIVYEFDNSGFDNVTITDLSYRGNGGRAYQVIVERDGNKFKVDLREDTLMDVIRNTGIHAGGKLNGTFCFVREAAQTNIIREGTERYKAAKAETEKKATYTDNIKKADLKPGYMYSSIAGDKKIFLGHVYSRSIDKYTGTISKPYKGMLFIDSSEVGESTLKLLNDGKFTKEANSNIFYWKFKIMKSHSLKIEEGKRLDVDLEKFVEHINAFGEEGYDFAINQEYRGSYWIDTAIDCYELAHFKANKADLDFNDSEGTKMVEMSKTRYRW